MAYAYTAEALTDPGSFDTILRIGRRAEGKATEVLVCIRGEESEVTAFIEAVSLLRPDATPTVKL